MPQFIPLHVSDVRKETRDAVVVTLEPPADMTDDFRFTQGQYLTFRQTFEGEEVRRCYSICAGRDDGVLRVGIKRVDGGWFSTWANEELKAGDTMEAMPPMGAFHAPLEPGEGRHYLMFAGGSGVTPVLSLIKTILAEEPHSTISFVYANRSPGAIMFRGELEDLKNTYLQRLSILHILESEADIDLFSGRLDADKCAKLFDGWVDVAHADLAFICGPEPMMHIISDALKARGLAPEKIKIELFKSGQPGRPKTKAKSARADADAKPCKATIILDGARHEIDLASDEAVLDGALAAEIDAPHACRGGVCSTCKAKIVEGQAEMEANYALEDYEVERGYVLTCQARALTERLVVDYDQ